MLTQLRLRSMGTQLIHPTPLDVNHNRLGKSPNIQESLGPTSPSSPGMEKGPVAAWASRPANVSGMAASQAGSPASPNHNGGGGGGGSGPKALGSPRGTIQPAPRGGSDSSSGQLDWHMHLRDHRGTPDSDQKPAFRPVGNGDECVPIGETGRQRQARGLSSRSSAGRRSTSPAGRCDAGQRDGGRLRTPRGVADGFRVEGAALGFGGATLASPLMTGWESPLGLRRAALLRTPSHA